MERSTRPAAITLVAVATASFLGCAGAIAATCDKPELSRQRLTEIALTAARSRGLGVEAGASNVTVAERNCEYDVSVALRSLAPGSHFFIRIARDGHILEFRRGL